MVVERKTASLKQQRSIDTREAVLTGAARAFARLSYSGTRLRDIALESDVSEGAMYFHFGTKSEIAAAVLATQQERMTAVLVDVEQTSGRALDKLRLLVRRLAELFATDEIVQGGTRLINELDEPVSVRAREPYFEWIRIGRSLIEHGIGDGSIRADLDVDAATEYLNSLFVGAQVLSGLDDQWASLPRNIERLLPFLVEPLKARDS